MAPGPNMVTALRERRRPNAWTFRATQALGAFLVLLILDGTALDWRMCRELQLGSRQLQRSLTQEVALLRQRVGWW